MELIELLVEFYKEDRATDQARSLTSQIREYGSAIVDEYTRFFNNYKPKYQEAEWHFWWIFAAIPLKDQLYMVEKAMNSAGVDRTRLERRIVNEKQLLELFQIPEDSPHKTLMKMLAFGWYRYISVCSPSEDGSASHLRDLIPFLKTLLLNQQGDAK